MATYALPLHHHGKSKVRLGRVWRDGNVHHMVEWNVNTMIDSDMEHAFLNGDNTGMTATDTQKNTVSPPLARAGYRTGLLTNISTCNPQVYVVAQRMSQKCTIEQYAIALAQHFVRTYPLVSRSRRCQHK